MTELPDTNAHHQVLVSAFDGYDFDPPEAAPYTLRPMINEDPEAALTVLDLGAEFLSSLGEGRFDLLQAVVRYHEAAARRVLEDPELRAVPAAQNGRGLIYSAVQHHRSVRTELPDYPEACRRPYGGEYQLLMWGAQKHADLALAALERDEFDDLHRDNFPWANTLVGLALWDHNEALLEALRPGGRLREQGRLADLVAILVEDALPTMRELMRTFLEEGRLDPASWPQRARLALLQAEDEDLRRQAMRAMGADGRGEDPPSGPIA